MWCCVYKSVFADSRLWGGWAAEEAGTVGWAPPGSVSSPSTASWTDPSWLRPPASWMTRGSGSDRLQVGRNRRERPPEPDPSEHLPAEEGGQPSPGSRAVVAVRFYAQTGTGTGTGEVSARTSFGSESWLTRVRLPCHALHPRPPPCPAAARPAPLRGFKAEWKVRWSRRLFYEPRRYKLMTRRLAPPTSLTFRPIRDEWSCIKLPKVCRKLVDEAPFPRYYRRSDFILDFFCLMK